MPAAVFRAGLERTVNTRVLWSAQALSSVVVTHTALAAVVRARDLAAVLATVVRFAFTKSGLRVACAVVAAAVGARVQLTRLSRELRLAVARGIQTLAVVVAVLRTAQLRTVFSHVFLITNAFSLSAKTIAIALIGAGANGAISTPPSVVTNARAVVAFSVVVAIIEAVLGLATRTNPEAVALAVTRVHITLSMPGAVQRAGVQGAILMLPAMVTQAGTVVADTLVRALVGTHSNRAVLALESMFASAHMGLVVARSVARAGTRAREHGAVLSFVAGFAVTGARIASTVA